MTFKILECDIKHLLIECDNKQFNIEFTRDNIFINGTEFNYPTKEQPIIYKKE
jgi:hypothetical protein